MKTYKLTALVAVILGITWGCQTDDSLNLSTESPPIQQGSLTKLGKKLDNPYSVKNMELAYEELQKEKDGGRLASEIDIRTTHLYLKFSPKDEHELELLTMDSTLILYEIPLDYEIEEGGSVYHDPEIPLGIPTYQYVSVPIGQMLPPVDYEILEECYVPEEDSLLLTSEGGRQNLSETAYALLRKAYELTGNLDEPNEGGRVSEIQRWTPKGRITLMDDPSNDGTGTFSRTTEIGMEGVTVRARNFIRTLTGVTDTNGYYVCDGPRFDSKANYSISWERDNFKVRDAWLSEAKYDGPKRDYDWNLVIGSDNHEQSYYATIFRAAFHYYYRDIQGLRRPPENGFLNVQMKIKATYQNEDLAGDDAFATHWASRRLWGSEIKIFSKDRTLVQLYSTTIHELAHASHWRMDQSTFLLTNSKVAESWARGPQWVLTRMKYPNYIGNGRSNGDYTLVVADMIDGPATLATRTNQGFIDTDTLVGGIQLDRVSGYSIRQIEDALKGEISWANWRSSIRDKFDNSTKGELYGLFQAYQ